MIILFEEACILYIEDLNRKAEFSHGQKDDFTLFITSL